MGGTCTHITDPVFNKMCRERYGLWDVWQRVGTGMYLVDEPMIRCKEHLLSVVTVLARMDYETGYLDAVVPHGTKLEGRKKALK